MENADHDLFQEILDTLQQWPELERNIFSQAHYKGRSAEDISRSLQLGLEDVTRILGECERRLHASLRNYRSTDRPSGFPADLPVVHTTAFKAAARPHDLHCFY